MVESGLQGIEEVSLIDDPPDSLSSYQFLMFKLDVDKLGCTVEQFAQGLLEDGIGGAGVYKVFPTDNPWYLNAAVFGTSGMPCSLRHDAVEPRRFESPKRAEIDPKAVLPGSVRRYGAGRGERIVKAIRKAIFGTAPSPGQSLAPSPRPGRSAVVLSPPSRKPLDIIRSSERARPGP